ncbi:MAG TPA: helix-turn-helix domain-containing protein [Patescibacteria group bacterium]|nr:helix-turn-helix domain-containing protein [Patescibacteria group bacterium]
MAKLIEKRKVIELRLQGKSYSEIKKLVNVSKSSLSLWLKDVHLSEKQIKRIKNIKARSIERFCESMRLKHQLRLDDYYEKQKNKLLPLTEKELFIAGLFLYSGEGNKVSRNCLSLANTDPSVIRLCYFWMKKSLLISNNKIFVKLHLYDDMNINRELRYWSRTVKIPLSQFKKPYIKKSFRQSIDQKGFGHGTCTLMVFNTIIKENVMMAIKAISDSYNEI